VPGFASVNGGTTGGGTDIASAILVNSMSALQAAAMGSNPAIILVEPGDYVGSLAPGANKTIIGIAPGVTITGKIEMSGSDVNNLIIRNLAVRGEPCASYDECRAGDDAVYMGNGAHHIWLDHLDIADGQDGNCDATQGSDFITVSWTHFHYTYNKEHRFSNLIAGSDDEPASAGKLSITYMNSHWGERVDSRQPRGRFGNIHMLNNYHDTGGGQIHGVGLDMALIAENSVYDENGSIWTDMGSPRGWRGSGNEGTASNLNDSRGSVFDIPYSYTAMPASQVVSAVTASDCGAGNSCTLAY
jgi:pectate lyase